MFCPGCFVDNDESNETCTSCGERLLPALSGGAGAVAEAAPGPAAEARPDEPAATTPAESAPQVASEAPAPDLSPAAAGTDPATSDGSPAQREPESLPEPEILPEPAAGASAEAAHAADAAPESASPDPGTAAAVAEAPPGEPTPASEPAAEAPSAEPPSTPAAEGAAAGASAGEDRPRGERRTHPRLEIPVDFSVVRLGPDGEELQKEFTIADNIGRGGMRVRTTMSELSEGDQLRVTEVGGDFVAVARVCGVWTGDDHIPRLNLQFTDAEAPQRLVGISEDKAGDTRGRPATNPPAAGVSLEQEEAAAAPAPEPEPSPEPETQPQPEEAPAAEATNEAPSEPETPPAEAPGATPEEAELRAEVLALHAALKSKSCYELLDIQRDADTSGIAKGYARQVRRFHPDRASGALADLKDVFAAIFVRIGDARELLSDPERRRSYDRMLGPVGAPTPPQAAVEPPPPPPVPPSEPLNAEQDAVLAEKRIAIARKLYKEEKYYDVILALEEAIPKTQSETLRNTMRVLVARANAKNPKWLRRAEEMLLDIIKDDPRQIEAHMSLGQIYRGNGLVTRAARMYRKVLELDPGHQEAASELNALMATRRI